MHRRVRGRSDGRSRCFALAFGLVVLCSLAWVLAPSSSPSRSTRGGARADVIDAGVVPQPQRADSEFPARDWAARRAIVDSAQNCPKGATNQIGLNGGWCLRASERKVKCCAMTPPCEEFCSWGYAIPWPHSGADHGLAKELGQFFQGRSVLDLGAGVGQYGQYFKENPQFAVRWRGFDGAENVEAYTRGFVRWTDLTWAGDPAVGAPSDWVLSLEVGEHIEANAAEAYVHNIDKYNTQGAVVSWAVPGQNGFHHVNELPNEDIRAMFAAKGYKSDPEAERAMRSASRHKWFKNTVMVFRRI